MSSRLAVVPIALMAAALAAGCGSDNNTSSAPSAGTSSSSEQGASTGETIKTAKSAELGTYLVDDEGRALYLFEKDTGRQSTCYDGCANAWPAVTTSADPRAEGQAKGSLLSTSERKTGKMQVLYNGHPLYYYAPDSGGSVKGQGLNQFGAEWYVLAPTGKKIEKGEEGEY